jgi:hypothetical protein
LDWFKALTGFHEHGYSETRAQLFVEDGRLHSRVNAKSYGIGELELVSLHDLCQRAARLENTSGALKVSVVRGDVGAIHCNPMNAGALFQVASQFNLLEMVNPEITPEDGVTRYQYDQTQGPACAMAAGAATIYRNYFAQVGHSFGQTADQQLDGLADVGDALSTALNISVGELWNMQNGYALATKDGLHKITKYLDELAQAEKDHLRGKLRIGLHHNVEVTAAPGPKRPHVSQAFCSALPVSYCGHSKHLWHPFAELVLEAAYEATLLAGTINAKKGGSNVIYLTLLGGGAFGNEDNWIYAAIERAFSKMANHSLDIRLVSYGHPPSRIMQFVQ